MHAKRNRSDYLQPAEQRFLLARVAAAFLETAGALRCRPEPRAMFDNVARGANAVHPKGWDAVIAGQIVMRAALATNDAAVIEQTAERVAHYADELKAAMLAPYLQRAGGSSEAAVVSASREGHEALHALTDVAVHRGCRARMEHGLRQVREMIAAAVRVERAFTSQLLSQGAVRTSRG